MRGFSDYFKCCTLNHAASSMSKINGKKLKDPLFARTDTFNYSSCKGLKTNLLRNIQKKISCA